MIKRVSRQALITLGVLGGLSAFIDWKRLPLSIIIGGLLALANFRGLHWGVTGLFSSEEASESRGKLVFFSVFRLLILFALLALLLYLRLVNVIGILAGLTVVFFFIVIEGFREAKKL